jgi:hypothetical protein
VCSPTRGNQHVVTPHRYRYRGMCHRDFYYPALTCDEDTCTGIAAPRFAMRSPAPRDRVITAPDRTDQPVTNPRPKGVRAAVRPRGGWLATPKPGSCVFTHRIGGSGAYLRSTIAVFCGDAVAVELRWSTGVIPAAFQQLEGHLGEIVSSWT